MVHTRFRIRTPHVPSSAILSSIALTRFGKIEVNRHDVLAALTLDHSRRVTDVRVALMAHLYLYVVVQVLPALLPNVFGRRLRTPRTD
jgi:hypothetical protein